MADMETPNSLMAVFSDTVSAGFAALQGPVDSIFGLMIALVVALTGVQWALSPNRDLLAAGFGKVLLIGAFAYLINDWQALSETVQAGFIDLGLTAGGGSLSRADFLNPGAILQSGWEIVRALGETPAPVNNPLDIAGNLTDALVLGLVMIGVMLSFAILALQIIVTLLEFKIVTLGGFVLLPFGIWTKSAFLAERPLGYVAASGLKVLALAIVVSGARTIFDQLQPSANPDLYEALAILAASLLLAMLAIFIPSLAAALVTGGPALGAGAAITSGLAVAGGGALAAAGAAGLGALAARTAGGVQAYRSAAGQGGAGPPNPTFRSWGAPGPGGGPRPLGGPNSQTGGRQSSVPSSASADFAGAPAEGGANAPRRPADRIQAEAEHARNEFRQSVAGGSQSQPGPRRSAALQAFFVANAGRSLMPGAESSGSLSPQIKPEEP